MSAEHREALEASLQQEAFPPDSDISERRRLLHEPAAGRPGSRQRDPGRDCTIDLDAAPGGVAVAEVTTAGIEPRHVVLYFHGGVHVLGDAFQAADLASHVGRRAGARASSIDYRF